MKYLSFTFDDGRRDNFNYALPILDKHNFPATIFCTTGYIDGSWQKSPDWYSANEAITFEELKTLQSKGWEVALHGDKHTTAAHDLEIANEKFLNWGFEQRPLGFSMPDSNISRDKLDAFIDKHYGTTLKYIRKGRRRSTGTIESKILFGLYTYLNSQWAYNKFNNVNLNEISKMDMRQIYSIVIRFTDNQEMISRFIDQMPENSWAVFMLHSILPEDNTLYGADAWNWGYKKFERLCDQVERSAKSGLVKVNTMNKIIDLIECR